MNQHSPFAYEDFERINDHPAILSAVEAADAAGTLTVWQLLAGARAGLRSGAYRDAERWLTRAATVGDPAVAAIAALEQAHWAIAAHLDLGPAKALLDAGISEVTGLSPAMQAEIDWLQARLVSALRIYREVSATRADAALDACLEAADRLHAAGLIRRAFAARVHVAERRDARDRAASLEGVAKRADAHGLPDYAASSYRLAAYACIEAERMAGAQRLIALAEDAYQRSGDVFGQLDVTALRQTAATARSAESLEPFEVCAEAFAAREHFASAMSCLLTLSTVSLRRGNTVQSTRYRERLMAIAMRVGARSMRVQDGLAKADAATRANRYSDASSYLAEILKRDLPVMLRAGALVQRSVVLSQLHEYDEAWKEIEKALALYVASGAEADASDLIPKLALDRLSRGDEAAFAEADALLANWIERDLNRHDRVSAVGKLEARIDIRAMRMGALKNAGDDIIAPLAEANQFLAQAREWLAIEPDAAGVAALTSSLDQHEGALAEWAGDTGRAVAAYAKAADSFRTIGNAFHAANCYYILGCFAFNVFNGGRAEDPASVFSLSRQWLQTALDFYRLEGGLQAQSAAAAEKLARLYLSAHQRLPGGDDRYLADARALIARSLDELEEVRRAYLAGDRLDTREGKGAHAAEVNALIDLGLRLSLLIQSDHVTALQFVSRQKSRILADLMGADLAVPQSLLTILEGDPRLAALLRDERAAVESLPTAAGDAIVETRQQLHSIYAAMAESPVAQPYVEVRRGEAPDAGDLPAILSEPDVTAVFVDWVDVAGQIWLLASRSDGRVEAVPTGASSEIVRTFRNANLTRSGFRLVLDAAPAMLNSLAPVIRPLAALTSPGDHLMLCPTGPLGAVPLHALPVDGGTLIERNPLFYAPSLGVLRTCRMAPDSPATQLMSLFGVLDETHTASAGLVARLTAAAGVMAMSGAVVTQQTIIHALSSTQVVHFQGHGEHNAASPLESCLWLSGGERLTARRIFGLRTVATRLVVLGACEGAVSRTESGDELLGLIPAFLAAGVSSLIAASWRVKEPTAAHFMEVFYDGLRVRKLRPIEAVRDAALAVKWTPDTQTPYHWAAFVGYGDPWRRLTGV
jgi:CHAT domain-containing protein